MAEGFPPTVSSWKQMFPDGPKLMKPKEIVKIKSALIDPSWQKNP
jgi:hypothetical protein